VAAREAVRLAREQAIPYIEQALEQAAPYAERAGEAARPHLGRHRDQPREPLESVAALTAPLAAWDGPDALEPAAAAPG
jgi:hypothetical protein